MGGGKKKNENENENGRKREFATDPRSKRAREKYAVRARPSLRLYAHQNGLLNSCRLACQFPAQCLQKSSRLACQFSDWGRP